MFNKKKITVFLLIFTLIITGLAGCSSSSDPIADATKLFATISKTERLEPKSLGLTKEQAEELIVIINPVVAGMPLTADLAKTMLKDTEKLLTSDQRKKIEETSSSLGTPSEGQEPGSGGGMGGGAGTGVPGSGGGTPGSGTAGGSNMFIRLDDIITTNYLED